MKKGQGLRVTMTSQHRFPKAIVNIDQNRTGADTPTPDDHASVRSEYPEGFWARRIVEAQVSRLEIA